MTLPSRRLLLRLAGGLLALIIAGSLLCFDTVDYRPYFRQAYYTNTTARLALATAAATVARGELDAGFGRALLTPAINAAQEDPTAGRFKMVPLAGFGNRKGRPATGVHDDLYVKAVALRVGDRLGVMVGTDALIIPPEVTALAEQQLADKPGLRREQLYLSATHTHSSIGGWGNGRVAEEFAGPFHAGLREWFAGRIAAAVREAVADLKPASFGHGSFSAPDFVRNRLVGSLGRTDPQFSFALVEQVGGKRAVLGSFSAHATVLSAGMMQFSADYPGYWERAVEEKTGGLAIFLAGAVGSHSPNAGARGLEGAERMGQALARDLIERLPQTTLSRSNSFGFLGLEVSMPPLNARLTDSVRLRPWLAARLLHPPPHSFLQVFRINDAIWISTPCDFSGEMALDIKETLHARNFDAVITSFNGDYVGYVILPRYYHLDGYEPRTMSFFGPNVPDYFNELIRTMALGIANN